MYDIALLEKAGATEGYQKRFERTAFARRYAPGLAPVQVRKQRAK